MFKGKQSFVLVKIIHEADFFAAETAEDFGDFLASGSLRVARSRAGLQPLSEAEAAAIVGARLLATRADEQRGLRFCS
jgi:hypothetical protein